jgi:hypothetical protein
MPCLGLLEWILGRGGGELTSELGRAQIGVFFEFTGEVGVIGKTAAKSDFSELVVGVQQKPRCFAKLDSTNNFLEFYRDLTQSALQGADRNIKAGGEGGQAPAMGYIAANDRGTLVGDLQY